MPARCIVISAWAVAFLFSLPGRAAAQKSVFVDAFIEFHSALYGTYGNEGPRVTAALDRMAASLDVWEQANREAERSLKALTGTTPADLALLYADQQRLDDAAAAIRAAIAANPSRPAYHVFEGLLDQATGRLADAGRASDVAVPRDNRGRHPLCASYHRRIAGHLKSRIDRGELRVGDALDGLTVREIGPDELSAFDVDGRLLLNVNTPADYEQARALTSAR